MAEGKAKAIAITTTVKSVLNRLTENFRKGGSQGTAMMSPITSPTIREFDFLVSSASRWSFSFCFITPRHVTPRYPPLCRLRGT